MRDNRVDFGTAFPKALQSLDTAVQEVISSGWEEYSRSHAHELAAALTMAAKDAHWWETEAVLRPIVALLALSPRELFPIQEDVRGKLLELLALLKRFPASRSA